MAKKKRKKIKRVRQQDMFRTMAKHQEQLFWQKANEIADAIGAGIVMDQLSKKEKEFLLLARIHPVQVRSTEELKLPHSLLKIVQGLILDYLASESFSFPGSDQEFPLIDYFTVVLTLKTWLESLQEGPVATRELYAQAFAPLLDFCEADNRAETLFANLLNAVSNALALPGRVLYYLEVESIRFKPGRSASVVLLKAQRPEKASVTFNGGTRPVHLLSFVRNCDPHCVTLKANLLNPKAAEPDKERRVYIQNHALNRLRERVDCFAFNSVYFNMCTSFDIPEVIPAGKHRGLVSFYYSQIKIGYFAIEETDGLIVIRTFLFLTSDNTPEGSRLRRRLGLARMDKQYNGLDKLSTFLLSDIREDDELCAVLKETGCGNLLSWDKKILETVQHDDSLRIPTAESIKNYLMLCAS